MKKILVVLLAMLMCVSMFALTACDGDDDHTHSYGSWSVSSNATCTTPGYDLLFCNTCKNFAQGKNYC